MDREKKNVKIERETLERDRDALERTQGLAELDKLRFLERLIKSKKECEELKKITRLTADRLSNNGGIKTEEGYAMVCGEHTKMIYEKNMIIPELNKKLRELKNQILEKDQIVGVCHEKLKSFDRRVAEMDKEVEKLKLQKWEANQIMEELRGKLSESELREEKLRLKNMEASQILEQLRHQILSAEAHAMRSDETMKKIRWKQLETDQNLEELRRQNLEASQTVEELSRQKLEAEHAAEMHKKRSDQAMEEMARKLLEADHTVKELRQQNLEAFQTVEELKHQNLAAYKAAEVHKKRFENLVPMAEELANLLKLKVDDLATLVNLKNKSVASEVDEGAIFPVSNGGKQSLGNGSKYGAGNTVRQLHYQRNKKMSDNLAPDIRRFGKSSYEKRKNHQQTKSLGMRSTCNSIESGCSGLTERGDRNLPQSSWTKQGAMNDDNAVWNSPSVQSGYSLPQAEMNGSHQENGSKKLQELGPHASLAFEFRMSAWCSREMMPSSAAARDIIEIIDCDDETNPVESAYVADLCTNLSETEMISEKVVSSPSSNQTNKQNRIDCSGVSLIIPKRKRSKLGNEDDNLLVDGEKEDQNLESTHNRHASPGKPNSGSVYLQEALLPSRGNSGFKRCEEKAGAPSDSQSPLQKIDGFKDRSSTHKLHSKKFCKTWMFGADMLKAFQEDDEICLNAVCALYRQQVSASKSTRGSNGVFYHFETMRGRTLAEYLIDGDPELRLRKSVPEIKQQFPDVLNQCRRLATDYYENLFILYCNGEDPFFKSR
ncbi:hypothetical protein Pfo_025307 [Paulownia fortunei]|nr:hypothetical protein Pfo_025307 [Paulownia fortunei]